MTNSTVSVALSPEKLTVAGRSCRSDSNDYHKRSRIRQCWNKSLTAEAQRLTIRTVVIMIEKYGPMRDYRDKRSFGRDASLVCKRSQYVEFIFFKYVEFSTA